MEDEKNRMKEKTRTVLCGLLACLILLTACTKKPTEIISDAETTPEPDITAEAVMPAASVALHHDSTEALPEVQETRSEDGIDKEETVYIKANPDGSLRSAMVEAILNYSGENGYILDRSNLDSIRNTEGDEEFRQRADGTLLWEDHGEKIHYEGKSREGIPVSVKISYTLDGVPVQPDALAGKSGHLKIRFDYENRTRETRSVSLLGSTPRDVQTKIPFLAITMAMLPDEVFSNIRVTNGKILRLGEQNAFLGWAVPGLPEAVTFADNKLTEDLEFPVYAELEADVREFKLDFTATVFSNGLFENLEQKDLDDLYDLTADIDELYDAAAQLAEGSEAFGDGMSAYTGGVNEMLRTVQNLAADLPALEDEVMRIAAEVGGLENALTEPPQQLDDASDLLTEAADSLSGLQNVLSWVVEYGGYASGAIEGAMAANAAASEANARLAQEIDSAQEALQEARIQINEMALTIDLSDEMTGMELSIEQQSALKAALSAALGSEIDRLWTDITQPVDMAGESLNQTIEEIGTISYSLGQSNDALQQAKSYTDAIAGTGGTELDMISESLRATAEQLGTAAQTLRAVRDSAVIQDFIYKVSALSAGLDTTLPEDFDYNAEIQNLINAGELLNNAAHQLEQGNAAFRDGIAELADDGGWRLRRLARELAAMRAADLEYTNFGGIADGRKGSVRFIVETDAIE